MNHEKVKDFFSAYREGTLEAGLRQTLEQTMVADENLRREYASFDRAMLKLDDLKFDEIEIPEDLGDRIRARIDLSVHEKKKAAPPGWFVFSRNFALTGVAAALVLVTYMSVRHRSDQSVGVGGAVLNVGSEQVSFKSMPDGRGVRLVYAPSVDKTIVVTSGIGGPVLTRIDLNGRKPVDAPLENNLPDASLVAVEVVGEKHPVLVALPGTQATKASKGVGELKDLTVALASFYRQPVVVVVDDPSAAVTWSFRGTDQRRAAESALDDQKYTVTTLDSGILKIMDR